MAGGGEEVREGRGAAAGNGEIPDGVDLDVAYVGSPEYRITVRAPDYKTAEAQLEAAAERARESIAAAGGTGAFHRERREDDE